MCEKQLLASSRLSVHPSTCFEQLSSPGRIFMKFYIWVFFRKPEKKIQVSSKYDKNNGYFTWITITFLSYLVHFFLESEMLQAKVVQKINTQILCSTTFPKIVLFRGWSGKMCWGKYLDLRGMRWQGNGESCITRSWMICTPYPILCGW